MAYLFLGLLTLFFAPQINQSFNVISRYTYLVGGVSTLAGVGGLLLAYLRGDVLPARSEAREYEYLHDEAMNRISAELSILRNEIAHGENRRLPIEPEDKAALRAELKTELREVLASDVVAQIEQKFSTEIAGAAQVSQIRSAFDKTISRLRQEIAALSRRSNVNLVIGVLTTVVAVSLLAYLVLRSPSVPFAGVSDILSHFIPRISVAVFIEVFSFFFLRLYKSNLEEIKYFQNELTNVDMKVIALEAALLTDKNKSSDTIVEQLIRTDRNSSPSLIASSNELKSVEPKDIADLLDKIGKILNLGTNK